MIKFKMALFSCVLHILDRTALSSQTKKNIYIKLKFLICLASGLKAQANNPVGADNLQSFFLSLQSICCRSTGTFEGSEKPRQRHEKVRRKLFHVMIDISLNFLIDYLNCQRNLIDVQASWSCWRHTHTMLLNLSPGSRLLWYSKIHHRSNRQGSFSSVVYL
jgi:hypothetical protein